MAPDPIIRSDDLRLRNRERVLRTLRDSGPLSRRELTARTGLSASTLSNQISALQDQSVLSSTPVARNAPGRPRTRIALTPNIAQAATLSIRMGEISAQLYDYTGLCLGRAEQSLDTGTLDEKSLLECLTGPVRELVKRSEGGPLRHLSVGFQGLVDSRRGDLLWSPIMPLAKVPVARHLQRHFKVPVTVNNDCRLIADALYRDQHEILGESFLAILFSYGIGMGLYLKGEPFTGNRSSALELGHLLHRSGGALCRCGRRGCIEAYASDYGIARAAQGLLDSPPSNALLEPDHLQQLAEAARNGDTAARRAFDEAGQALGQGLAAVFTLLDPMPVALVGSTTRAYGLMQHSLQGALELAPQRLDGKPAPVICFDTENPLLEAGLQYDALNHIDKQLAVNIEPVLS